ncbi:hypothetical protein F4782DRAFT_549987 [Xylaria castorea]|nr:hypothetical protein F4782DRAFT_549987 [Xylaria castorea]
MNQETRPSVMESTAGSAAENVISGSAAAAPAITTTTTSTTAKPSSRRSHRCGIDNCAFISTTAKGVREHQKNKHLGTECYWMHPDNEFCGCTALSHQELYEHFNGHLRAINQSGPPYQCCWPGNPGIPIPGGPPVPYENRCEQTFQQMSGADRHAREHQHKIWRAMESAVWPVPRQ